MRPSRSDRIGQVFGRLTVVAVSSRAGHLTCKCECGKVKDIASNNLYKGTTRSCGCLAVELSSKRLSTHGQKGSPTWSSWQAMKSRCLDPANVAFSRYGGKGVTIDPKWYEYEGFLEDMGERPEGTSLDRFPDVSGNYCKLNCRWATDKQQARNKSSSRTVLLNGEVMHLYDACESLGVSSKKVYCRFYYLHRKDSTITLQDVFESFRGDEKA